MNIGIYLLGKKAHEVQRRVLAPALKWTNSLTLSLIMFAQTSKANNLYGS